MKSHTILLNQLINALYAAPLSPEIHPYQILAAEIRGQMGVIADDDAHHITCDCYKCVPTATMTNASVADSDGWVVNTGVMPECDVSSIRHRNGLEVLCGSKTGFEWAFAGSPDVAHASRYDITHYKPL